MISFHRRKDNEHVEINRPCISMVLSGTPRQVILLIPDAENGLLSRFIFYLMNNRPKWKDMLDEEIADMEACFDALGKEFYSFYKALEKHPAIEFRLSPSQHEQFNDFFSQLQEKYLSLQGMDFMATVRRLGLIAFRMAMVLTSLRMMEAGRISTKLECSDSDFQRVLSMIRVLVEHSSQVFYQLPAVEKQFERPRDRKEQFLHQLPEKFTFQDFISIAKSLEITERTANRYIATFCEKGLVVREQAGCYINLTRRPAEEGHP
jgi:hypothetical protein